MAQRPRFGDGRQRVAALLLLAFYLLVYILPLGVRPLASPDEVRYGEIPREMLVTGDWVSPHFNGVRYFEKPAPGYWITAASIAVFGQNAFGVRLPVALAAGLTALLVLALAKRFLSLRAALLAAGIFLSTLLVSATGTFSILDPYFSLFLTAALAAYYLGIEATTARRRRLFLALCGAACGGAFLVKGFLGLAIPVIVAVPFLVARRRWRTLFTSGWWPIAIAALVIAPWAILIQLHEPDFWHYFFWMENIKRFASEHAQHAQPFWFYFAELPAIGWPWIGVLPAALIGLWTARRQQGSTPAPLAANTPAIQQESARTSAFLWYLAAWAGLPLLFFTLSEGKLQTYLLPCFPPLAILVAAGLERYFSQPGRRVVLRIAAWLSALAFLLVLVALAASQYGLLGIPAFAPDETLKTTAFAACVLIGLGTCVFAAWNHPPHRTAILPVTALMLAGAATILPLQVTVPQRAIDRFAPALIIKRLAPVPASTLLVSDDRLFGTVSWVFKRTDIYTLSAGEMDYGVTYPEARHRLLDNASLARLIATRGPHAMIIICYPNTAQEIRPVMPSAATHWQKSKVVVWRIPPAQAAAPADAGAPP